MSAKVDGDYWRHECNRCGYVWYTLRERPNNCRGCNSPYWDKERVR